MTAQAWFKIVFVLINGVIVILTKPNLPESLLS
jgi:hypothetical protein